MKPSETFKNIAKVYLAQTGSFIWEVAKVVVISLAIIIPVRYFLFQPFYVKGSSMEPNFFDYEYLIIDEISYRFHEPDRGDVVVLHDPRDTSQYFIKRVVGLPGETVTFTSGKVFINDKVLDESVYLADDVLTTTFNGDLSFTLADDEYVVLGDNRIASYDSRRFGPIHKSTLVGRSWVRAWPFDRITVFE